MANEFPSLFAWLYNITGDGEAKGVGPSDGGDGTTLDSSTSTALHTGSRLAGYGEAEGVGPSDWGGGTMV